MSPDDKIAAFLGAARPAADPGIDAEVMARVARREFARAVGLSAVAAAAGGVALWAAGPVLAEAFEPAVQNLTAGVGVLVAAFGVLALGEWALRRA